MTGEIKFDAARMQEVYNRLDEIKEQLITSTKNTSGSLDTINSKINGPLVKTILSKYTETNNEVCNEITTKMVELQEYLRGKIGSYTATEAEAAEELANVQSILQGLE